MLQGLVDLIFSLKRLSHPNVVPFIGVTIHPFQLVAERVSNRNPMEYLEEHPEADRIGLVSPLLLIAFDQLQQCYPLLSCWM